MVMRVPAFPRPLRPPRPMFRGVMPPPPPPGPYGQFPPGPPRFPPGGGPPPGVFGPGRDCMPLRAPSMRVFGPPPPPPPPFLRGPGAMRSRPLFRPPKFSPYPAGGVKAKNGHTSPGNNTNAGSSNHSAGTDTAAKNPSADGADLTQAVIDTSQSATTTNGTTTSCSSTAASAQTTVTTAVATNTNSTSDSSAASNGLAAAVEAAERDGIPVDMIQALYCKLCDAKLNGSLQATAHYVGKSHAKKVKQYQHGQGRIGQLRLNAAAASGSDAGKTAAGDGGKRPVAETLEKFCKLCDVAFTSEIQAKQHYDGRNHQRRMRGEPPLPKGFYNPATGRWQRQPPPGMAIRPAQPRKQSSGGNPFFCEPCNTSLTSEQQLQSHLQGAKHKARLGGLATAVAAQVVTANAAVAMATAAAPGTVAAAGGHQPAQLPQPYVAFVPGPTMTRVSPCGTC